MVRCACGGVSGCAQKKCDEWAAAGECKRNADYMAVRGGATVGSLAASGTSGQDGTFAHRLQRAARHTPLQLPYVPTPRDWLNHTCLRPALRPQDHCPKACGQCHVQSETAARENPTDTLEALAKLKAHLEGGGASTGGGASAGGGAVTTAGHATKDPDGAVDPDANKVCGGRERELWWRQRCRSCAASRPVGLCAESLHTQMRQGVHAALCQRSERPACCLSVHSACERRRSPCRTQTRRRRPRTRRRRPRRPTRRLRRRRLPRRRPRRRRRPPNTSTARAPPPSPAPRARRTCSSAATA